MINKLHRWVPVLALLFGVVSLEAHDGPHGEDAAHASKDSAPLPPMFTTRPEPRVLPLAKSEDVFHFVVYGDRTGGVPEGLRVLEQAVVDTNLLDPDLVMTVGDLIQGYNESPEWLLQMDEYKKIMDRLKMRWFPVAGNHDVYWRGEGPAPQGQHEGNYEKHFGPLWYSFAHKNAGFIVLYSDEGDPETNQKAFNVGALQRMSDDQLAFLDAALKQHHEADHVFLFLHHPRWIGGGYEGGNWDIVHEKLKAAGNVSAVFAGHIHQMRYDGPKDGIDYYALATTGGHLESDFPGAGYLHHLNIVTVRPKTVSVAALPVGAVIDPKEFTKDFLADARQAQSIRPIPIKGDAVLLSTDGSADGEVRFKISNPSKRPVDGTVAVKQINRDWTASLDHEHLKLAAGETKEIAVRFRRHAGEIERLTTPQMRLDMEYRGQTSRIALPAVEVPVPIDFAAVPADYFANQPNQCLHVKGESSSIRVNSSDLPIPDGPLTVEAWLNPDQSAGYRGVVAKTQSSEFAIFMDEGVPQFDVFLNGTYVTAHGKDVLRNGQWTHVAGVFDGTQVQIYVGGKLIDSKPGSGKRRTNELPLYIGADTDGASQPARSFLGKIDEVRISTSPVYNSEFTPERRLQPRPDSVLMLHLDRQIGPYSLDHSDSAAKANLLPDAKLVDTN